MTRNRNWRTIDSKSVNGAEHVIPVQR